MAKLIPLPLEPIRNSKILPTISLYARAAVINVLIDWWIADCPPIEQLDIQTMIRARECDWSRHQAAIRRTLGEIAPPLAREHAHKTQCRANQAASARKWIAIAQAEKREHDALGRRARIASIKAKPMQDGCAQAKDKASQTDRTNKTQSYAQHDGGIIQPFTERKVYDTGMTDLVSRNAAVSASARSTGTLTDK